MFVCFLLSDCARVFCPFGGGLEGCSVRWLNPAGRLQYLALTMRCDTIRGQLVVKSRRHVWSPAHHDTLCQRYSDALWSQMHRLKLEYSSDGNSTISIPAAQIGYHVEAETESTKLPMGNPLNPHGSSWWMWIIKSQEDAMAELLDHKTITYFHTPMCYRREHFRPN